MDSKLKKINDIDVVQVVNEVRRPFQFMSMLNESEPLRCGNCKHLVRKERLVDIYYEPYFVCDALHIEIDWPYRDSKPNGCSYEDYESN